LLLSGRETSMKHSKERFSDEVTWALRAAWQTKNWGLERLNKAGGSEVGEDSQSRGVPLLLPNCRLAQRLRGFECGSFLCLPTFDYYTAITEPPHLSHGLRRPIL
jgi:hypothetical protein